MFQMEINGNDEDLEVIKNPMATPNGLQEHLAFTISRKKDEMLKSVYEIAMQMNEHNLKLQKIKKPINGYQIQFSKSFEEPEYLSNELWP